MAEKKSSKLHPNAKDISGFRFGRLIVMEVSHSYRPNRHSATKLYWHCICDCGTRCVVHGASLRRGETQSCGCYMRDRCIETSTTHGLSYSTEFDIWNMMIQRCHNPRNQAFHNYGGRGISVCQDWRDSFEAFYSHVGPRPKGHSIDRIDNDGNYEPGNVRWATRSQQSQNRRKTVHVIYNGENVTLQELADRLGVQRTTMYARYRTGVNIFAPPRRRIKENK